MAASAGARHTPQAMIKFGLTTKRRTLRPKPRRSTQHHRESALHKSTTIELEHHVTRRVRRQNEFRTARLLGVVLGGTEALNENLARCSGLSSQGRDHCGAQKDCTWCLPAESPSIGKCHTYAGGSKDAEAEAELHDATRQTAILGGSFSCTATPRLGRAISHGAHAGKWL